MTEELNKKDDVRLLPFFKIQQIMPAPTGLRAVFGERKTPVIVPVVALALCRVHYERIVNGQVIGLIDEEDTKMCGLVCGEGFDIAEEEHDFRGYLPNGETPGDTWMAIACSELDAAGNPLPPAP